LYLIIATQIPDAFLLFNFFKQAEDNDRKRTMGSRIAIRKSPPLNQATILTLYGEFYDGIGGHWAILTSMERIGLTEFGPKLRAKTQFAGRVLFSFVPLSRCTKSPQDSQSGIKLLNTTVYIVF
jgi:hypothetical protein